MNRLALTSKALQSDCPALDGALRVLSLDAAAAERRRSATFTIS